MPTLITSWGGPGSTAYVALTEANTIITCEIFDSAAWTATTTIQQALALIEGASQIDHTTTFIGARFYHNQSMQVPRRMADYESNATNATSMAWSETHQRMERDVKRANCYQALHLCRIGGQDKYIELQARGVKQVTEGVGPVYEGVTLQGGSRHPSLLHPQVTAILARWKTGRKVYRA